MVFSFFFAWELVVVAEVFWFRKFGTVGATIVDFFFLSDLDLDA